MVSSASVRTVAASVVACLGMALAAPSQAAGPEVGALPESLASVTVVAPDVLARGETATLVMNVTGADGYTISPVSSLIVRDAPRDARLKPPELIPGDSYVEIHQPIVLTTPGVVTLKLLATLPACRSDQCFIVQVERTVRLEVLTAPSARDMVKLLVERRLANRHEALVQCLYSNLPEAPSPFVATIIASGGGGGTSATEDANADQASQIAASCAQQLVNDLYYSGGEASVRVTLELARMAAPRDGFNGRRGDVCRIGSISRDEAPWLDQPVPKPCGPGLRCCGGGRPESGATCVAAPRCPLLP